MGEKSRYDQKSKILSVIKIGFFKYFLNARAGMIGRARAR
jgi:hypothetical protein